MWYKLTKNIGSMKIQNFTSLPNKFFYFIAKEYLRHAYPKIHGNFFDFEIKKKKGLVIINCFNGCGWVYLSISYFNEKYRIKRTGSYKKHNRVDSVRIIKKAFENIDNIKDYYSIRFQENISTLVRCVDNIEEGKNQVIKHWNHNHSQSKISEPIDWVIAKV